MPHMLRLSAVEEDYIDVPVSHAELLHICEKIGLIKISENRDTVRMNSEMKISCPHIGQ